MESEFRGWRKSEARFYRIACDGIAGLQNHQDADSGRKGGGNRQERLRSCCKGRGHLAVAGDPYLQKRAGDLKDVVALATSSPDEAGAKYGNARKQASAPWTYAVKLTGKVIAADTGSRAATIDVDADGDGKADAKVQIGPAVRGTALRDTLEFVNFNEFKNQIEWAQFGKAFNEKINTSLLASLPRDGLTGKTLTVTGAFPLPASGQPPLVTPAEITVGP
jgi:predicted lipoprotein